MEDPKHNDIDLTETSETRLQRGLSIVEKLSGGSRPESLDSMRQHYPFLSQAVNAFAVGEIFNRNIIDVKTRQLALVAAFAALGLGEFIKIHAGYAMNMGVTPEQLKEIVYLTIIPGGFPRAIQASQALNELFAARGVSTSS